MPFVNQDDMSSVLPPDLEKKPRDKGRWAKWLFPIGGLLSLVWFLGRVIPKPSRMAYPCQRVAAPLAAGFLVWLIGAVGSVFAWRQGKELFRRSRLVKAMVCFAIGGVVGIVAIINMPEKVAVGAAPGTNVPIGSARGINPGRVVWVHNPEATDWLGAKYNGEDNGDGFWWQSDHTDQDVVDDMMSQSLRGLTGEVSEGDAWDEVFVYFNQNRGKGDVGYKAGEKISIKVNMATAHPSWPNVIDDNCNQTANVGWVNTSPQMILALLRQLVYVVGVEQSDITVGDSTCYFPNHYWNYVQREFGDVNYLAYKGGWGRQAPVTPSSAPVYWSTSNADGKNQDYLPVSYAEAEYLINFACLKGHSAGITLCAKNHYGSFNRRPPAIGFYDLHTNLPGYPAGVGIQKYREHVDIMGNSQLGGKTLLYLIDGLYGGYRAEGRPYRWASEPFNGDWPSSLFVSQDPVAIDSVGYEFLLNEWENIVEAPGLQGATHDYLHEGALADAPPSGTFYDPDGQGGGLESLGVHEHWNNPIDKQYSRNLGTGDGIELFKVEVDLVGAFGNSTLPPGLPIGSGADGEVEIIVTNTGNLTIGPGGEIDIDIVLRPVWADGVNNDVVLGRMTDKSIGPLAPNESVVLSAEVTVPSTLEADVYKLVAIIDSDQDISEADESNNEAVASYTIGVADDFVDLKGQIVNSRLPRKVISGDGTKITLPVMVINSGTVGLGSGERISLAAYAVSLDKVDDDLSGDPVAILANQSVGGLRPGASRKINMPITLPAGLVMDKCIFKVKVDYYNEVEELNEFNNIATSPYDDTILVELGYFKLEGKFGKITLPQAIIAGDDVIGKAQVKVKNVGNVATGKNQHIDVIIEVKSSGAGQSNETILVHERQSIGNLKPRKRKIFNFNITMPDGLLDLGEYNLAVTIIPLDEAGGTLPGTVGPIEDPRGATSIAAPYIDLVVDIVNPQLPALLVAGDGTKIKLPLEIRNIGNVAVNKGQTIDVSVKARPVWAGDDPNEDMEVDNVVNASISGLKSGATKKLNANVSLPGGLEGEYVLVVEVDAGSLGGSVAESNEDNNYAVTSIDSPINVAGDFLGLTQFDAPESWWTYEADIVARGNMSREFMDTMTMSVDEIGENLFFVETEQFLLDTPMNETQKESFSWGRGDDGIYLHERTQEIYPGRLQLSFDQLQVVPLAMVLRQKYNNTSAVTGFIDMDYVPLTGRVELVGTITTSLSLLGYEAVTIEGQRFDSAKLVFSYKFKVTGDLTGGASGQLKIDGDETITYWAVPGVGVVQSTAKSKVKTSVQGEVNLTESYTEKCHLDEYFIP